MQRQFVLFVYPLSNDFYYRHGRGELVMTNGFKYDGSWVCNTMVSNHQFRFIGLSIYFII